MTRKFRKFRACCSPQITGRASNSKDLQLQTVWRDFIESHCVSTEVTNDRNSPHRR
jgi:hypothetical protein